MKKMIALLPIAACATLLGLTSLGDASAAPKIGRAKTSRVIRAMPELRCTIQAFEDAQGMKPVANGGTLGYGGGSPKVWVRVIVENSGGVSASDFKSSVLVKNNNATKFSADETLTLPPGLAKIYPLVQIPLGKSNQIQATASLDGTKVVSESNERNNACSFSVGASVVH